MADDDASPHYGDWGPDLMDVDQALNEERMSSSAEALHNVDSSARHGACEEMERGAGDSATAPVV